MNIKINQFPLLGISGYPILKEILNYTKTEEAGNEKIAEFATNLRDFVNGMEEEPCEIDELQE